MTRQEIAYLLIALVALVIAAAIAFRRHHSHAQTYQRQRRKEIAKQDRLLAEKMESPPE
jgi:hypothetical protein